MQAPRGIEKRTSKELQYWAEDQWAHSPYQYRLHNQVQSDNGSTGRLISCETELIMGFPKFWTAPILQLKLEPHQYEHKRKALLGNAWCVMVVIFVLQAI